MRSSWLWPAISILSAGATIFVTLVVPASPLRSLVVMWFLCVCPGIAPVRLLRFHEPVVEWTLVVALSFALDALVGGIQLYAGRWSPTLTLEILIALSLAGAIVQLATRHSVTTFSERRQSAQV